VESAAETGCTKESAAPAAAINIAAAEAISEEPRRKRKNISRAL
jgi:hypothetical protein